MSDPIQGLGRPPKLSPTHHWADYGELVCLANLDHVFTADDLIERWSDQNDILARDPEEEDSDVLNPPSTEPGEPKAALDDRKQRKAADVFEHYEYRATTFGDDYPFDLVPKSRCLVLKEPGSDRHRLYLFLLMASCLNYVPKTQRHRLTASFERLVAETLKHWLPSEAEVHIFGTAAGTEGRYLGTMWQKITKLGVDLGERLLLDEENFRPSDSGDLGLDVVAWLPLGDPHPGLPVWFAQATCQAKWKDKQHESGINWSNYLKESAPRGNLLFVPFCFRDPTGRWYDVKWPTAAVIVDRQRVLRLLKNHERPTLALPNDYMDEALAFREPV